MIEINLIPDVKQELLKAQRIRGIVISTSILISIISVGLLVLLLVYIYGVQGVRSAYLDGQIESKGTQLAQVEDLSQVLTIQHQLATISELNDEKLITSRTFDMVSAITPPGESTVSFSSIAVAPEKDATEGGVVRLEGQTAGFNTMEAFKKRIANTSFQYKDEAGDTQLVPLANTISTSDISYGEDATGSRVLRFTVSFEYPAELFSSATASQTLAFKLTVDGNVTDSYLGIPRFAERASDVPEDK